MPFGHCTPGPWLEGVHSDAPVYAKGPEHEARPAD